MVYNEKLNLESKFDAVADVVPGHENFRLKVSVVRMWTVPAFLNLSESVSLEAGSVRSPRNIVCGRSNLPRPDLHCFDPCLHFLTRFDTGPDFTVSTQF
jgi:hypothetical protein